MEMSMGIFLNVFYHSFACNLFLSHHWLKSHCHLHPLKETQQIVCLLLVLLGSWTFENKQVELQQCLILSFKNHITARKWYTFMRKKVVLIFTLLMWFLWMSKCTQCFIVILSQELTCGARIFGAWLRMAPWS